MDRFEIGDRVRIDIPDETDPDHETYHGEHGTVVTILEDDADMLTVDEQGGVIYRVELDTGEMADLRRYDIRPPFE